MSLSTRNSSWTAPTVAILLCFATISVSPFTLPAQQVLVGHYTPRSISSSSVPASFYNDFDGFESVGGGGGDTNTNRDNKSNRNSNANSDDDDLWASLRQRVSSLSKKKLKDMKRWKAPPVEAQKFPLLNDYVRRVAMDASGSSNYAVVGGASGSLYLIDLSAKANDPLEVLQNMIKGELKDLHESRGEEDFLELPGATTSASPRSRAIQTLYGEFDGGGVIALAMKDTLVASAGREGGIHVSKMVLDTTSNSNNLLEAMGKIPGVKSFVTSLAFDQSGKLWAGCFEDGTIRAFDVEDNDDDASTIIQPSFVLEAGAGIVDLFIADDIGCGVAATENNGVLLFSLTEGTILAKWDPFSWGRSNEFARSVAIVQNDESPGGKPMTIPDPDDPTKEATMFASASWSVVVGGSLGSLHQRRLNVQPSGSISQKRPFDEFSPIQQIPERLEHSGSIVALASPGPQVLLSASQDGSIHVWDCSYQQPQNLNHRNDNDDDMTDELGGSKPHFLYAMSGFKVWLGSMNIVTKNDQSMLVTDGADNTVLALVFKSKTSDEEEE